MNDENMCEDWDLVKLAQSENEPAYAVLMERYQDPIHRFIFRYIGKQEIAKDLTQEVFVKAYFALPKLEQKAKFSTWLFQIAINLCRDFSKSKAGRQLMATDSLTKNDHDDEKHQMEFSDTHLLPDQQAELNELTAHLEQLIHCLPDELRHPFLLGVIEQHSHKEVAAILKISLKAVETRIYRARKHLITELEKHR